LGTPVDLLGCCSKRTSWTKRLPLRPDLTNGDQDGAPRRRRWLVTKLSTPEVWRRWSTVTAPGRRSTSWPPVSAFTGSLCRRTCTATASSCAAGDWTPNRSIKPFTSTPRGGLWPGSVPDWASTAAPSGRPCGREESACATHKAATGDPPSVCTNMSGLATTVLFATRDTSLAALTRQVLQLRIWEFAVMGRGCRSCDP
jgi:hypothetical protein